MSRDTLRIGEVARRAGVNPQTLRYYERRGVIEKARRSDTGYREYGAETVRLIRFIKRTQELGFTLEEIEELVALRQHRGRNRVEVRRIAAAKAAAIEAKIRQLRSMRRALVRLVTSCSCQAEAPGCPILEGLDVAG